MIGPGREHTNWLRSRVGRLLLVGAVGIGAGVGAAQTPRFDDITASAGLEIYSPTFGAVFSDVDNDGDDDLLVSRHLGGPTLYLNQGGQFFEASRLLAPSFGDRHGLVVADLDNDGDRDIVVAGGGADGIGPGMTNFTMGNLLSETGRLAFEDLTASSGLGAMSEYRSRSLIPITSSDGSRIDLYLACRIREGFPNEYYRNMSQDQLRFVTDPSSDLRQDFSTEGIDLVLDFDRDGDQDLLLIDRMRIRVLRRDPSGFTAIASPLDEVRRARSLAAGDLNNDGYPDLFVGTCIIGTGSDHVSDAAGHILYWMAGSESDSQDAISFRAEGDEIAVALSYKRGASIAPADIFLGAARDHPADRFFTTTTAAAAGAPDDRDDPGTYIWFDSDDQRWNVLWRHDPADPGLPYGGSIQAPEVWEVLPIETETTAPEPVADLIFANHLGEFSPWPNQPELVHDTDTGACLIEDLNNDSYPDIVGLRRGEYGDYNGDPFILVNRGPDLGFVVLLSAQLVNAEDALSRADQLITGFVNDDGLPDLFFSNGWGLQPSNLGPYKLFLNTTVTANHYVNLDLVGVISNRDALGAQVELWSSSRLLGYRELGSGFHRSQRSHLLHFGLGANPGPVWASIRWPSGILSEHLIEVDASYRIAEPCQPRQPAGRAR